VKAVVSGLNIAGCISDRDVQAAMRGLGVGRQPTKWDHESGLTWFARRGSPMGTPLSFIVLSWVNAFCLEGFTTSFHHGDDAVGFTPAGNPAISWDSQFNDYVERVRATGADVNLKKTFKSDHSWTACEVLKRTGKTIDGMAVFIPPPCAAPGIKAPTVAESRTPRLYLKRQERVMRTLFPWIVKDPRVNLPTCIAGLGYTGRGLCVSRTVRARLGALVSRGPTIELAMSLTAKKPFREMGLFPKSLVPAPKHQKAYWKARKSASAEIEPLLNAPDAKELVPIKDVSIFIETLAEGEYRMMKGDTFKMVKDSGRPARTKTGMFTKVKNVKLAKPLSRSHGLSALTKFAEKISELKVFVPIDIALEIRGWTPSLTQDSNVRYENEPPTRKA
jgi:hypothetical protein